MGCVGAPLTATTSAIKGASRFIDLSIDGNRCEAPEHEQCACPGLRAFLFGCGQKIQR